MEEVIGKKYNMRINKSKTEGMVLHRHECPGSSLTVNNDMLEDVNLLQEEVIRKSEQGLPKRK